MKSRKHGVVSIAIVGSRHYQSKLKIKDTIFMLKQNMQSEFEIVSGGAKDGADFYARKYAMELGVNYVEFNPACTSFNLYSAMPEAYYDQPFHVSHLFHRNTLIAMYCDRMIAFRSSGKSSGTDHVINEAIKYNKQVVIVDDKVA
jgi:predicted Rossmann fold nucleotide-binding protein DprA/Smf involved in DNA uptake